MNNRFNLHAVKYFVVLYGSDIVILNWSLTQGTCFHVCMYVCMCVCECECARACQCVSYHTRRHEVYKTFTLVTQNLYRPTIVYSTVAVSTGNTFPDLPQIRETADHSELYI
jgi:hypothetical protein